MKVVQIKGANAAGKTTIMRDLQALSNNVEVLSWPNGLAFATVLHDLKFILIGEYKATSRMGGMDEIPTAIEVRTAILQSLRMYPKYRAVIVEGMLLSTTKYAYYNLQLWLKKTKGYMPYIVCLSSTVKATLKRLEARGATREGGVKVANIKDKIDRVNNYGRDYKQKYVRWMYVDKIAREDMLEEFLKAIEEEL